MCSPFADSYLQAHPRRKQLEAIGSIQDDAESIGLLPADADSESIFDTEDADIGPLVAEFKNHISMMQANIAQYDGIDNAICQANAALATVLPDK